ncbi:MAG: glycosyltransferase family 2 protein [Lachnospiraceae bacterium]|nr:glycosyltransferase family 2 protein [Lachnospiraceae bacterium]
MSCLLSICIPAYNRVFELRRLLDSVDANNPSDIEIVLREDHSPKREEIRKTVIAYEKNSNYKIRYIENDENFGYDKNIRSLGESATGKWVMFMGDDDIFVPGSLDKFLLFLRDYQQLGYVLRRYQAENKNGVIEEYRYSNKNEFFNPGEKAVVEFFRRSLFISGFTYRKDCFQDYKCNDFDGTLLFQLYIQATICLHYQSAYCDIPITKSIEGGVPFFGQAESEKNLYESGANTFNNSINFLKQVRIVTEIFDKKNSTQITQSIMKSYARYSYGYLFEHREEGIKVFRAYAKEIKKIGLGDSTYFYIYYYGLLILGKKRCQCLIRNMKRIIGHTPRL